MYVCIDSYSMYTYMYVCTHIIHHFKIHIHTIFLYTFFPPLISLHLSLSTSLYPSSVLYIYPSLSVCLSWLSCPICLSNHLLLGQSPYLSIFCSSDAIKTSIYLSLILYSSLSISLDIYLDIYITINLSIYLLIVYSYSPGNPSRHVSVINQEKNLSFFFIIYPAIVYASIDIYICLSCHLLCCVFSYLSTYLYINLSSYICILSI